MKCPACGLDQHYKTRRCSCGHEFEAWKLGYHTDEERDNREHAAPPPRMPDGAPRPEVQRVPLWVKGLVAVALVLFLMRLPAFPEALADAEVKQQASRAFDRFEYAEALDGYIHLHQQYPDNTDFTRRLGFAYYRVGQYRQALFTFAELEGVTMPVDEVAAIEAALDDMAQRLGIETE